MDEHASTSSSAQAEQGAVSAAVGLQNDQGSHEINEREMETEGGGGAPATPGDETEAGHDGEVSADATLPPTPPPAPARALFSQDRTHFSILEMAAEMPSHLAMLTGADPPPVDENGNTRVFISFRAHTQDPAQPPFLIFTDEVESARCANFGGPRVTTIEPTESLPYADGRPADDQTVPCTGPNWLRHTAKGLWFGTCALIFNPQEGGLSDPIPQDRFSMTFPGYDNNITASLDTGFGANMKSAFWLVGRRIAISRVRHALWMVLGSAFSVDLQVNKTQAFDPETNKPLGQQKVFLYHVCLPDGSEFNGVRLDMIDVIGRMPNKSLFGIDHPLWVERDYKPALMRGGRRLQEDQAEAVTRNQMEERSRVRLLAPPTFKFQDVVHLLPPQCFNVTHMIDRRTGELRAYFTLSTAADDTDAFLDAHTITPPEGEDNRPVVRGANIELSIPPPPRDISKALQAEAKAEAQRARKTHHASVLARQQAAAKLQRDAMAATRREAAAARENRDLTSRARRTTRDRLLRRTMAPAAIIPTGAHSIYGVRHSSVSSAQAAPGQGAASPATPASSVPVAMGLRRL